MIKVVQINLHHCIVATTNLILYLNRYEIDVALIQEPWINRDKIMGLKNQLYNLFSINNINKPRTCILIKKNLSCFILRQFCNRDCTAVMIESQSQKFTIASAYFPHDTDNIPPPTEVRNLVEHCYRNKLELLIGCDANAHHILWGSTDTNDRGTELLDFIIGNELTLYNVGGEYTFETRTRKEVLDLTFGTLSFVKDWEVSKQTSFSDHKYIKFNITTSLGKVENTYRNPKRTDWDKFKTLVAEKMGKANLNFDNVNNIESSVYNIENTLISSFKKTCPIRKINKKKNQVWWNSNLKVLRKKTRKSFNEARREDTTEAWEVYRANLRTYKKETRKAQRANDEKRIEELKSIKDTSRLRKLLSKQESSIGNLQNSQGTWTNSSEESLKLLLQTHFPGCTFNKLMQDNRYYIDNSNNNNDNNNNDNLGYTLNIKKIITLSSVKWAINTFGPFKSPGLDDIYPKMLQEAFNSIGESLINIYSFCVRHSYIPMSWRRVKVVFIPKSGKIQHFKPKDFRPISFSSFMLKTLERILNETIRNKFKFVDISENQHPYIKGKSVDSALHSVVYHIEKSLSVKEFTLGAFLDIEGAFNNVESAAIQRALINIGVEKEITNWIMAMLKQRQIKSELGETILFANATRGTPQGGVISPLLWLLVVNDILRSLEVTGTKVVAYVDDLVVLSSGKFMDTVSDILSNSLSMLSSWARKCGLNVNPAKTELVLFTRKKKIPNFRLPQLNGVELSLSNSAKFLGIFLDSKLDWRFNLTERIKKAYAALYSCQKVIGTKDGIKPKLFHWLYTAIVRPVVTYGCHVWWPVVTKKVHSDSINRINRLALLCMTNAMRTTPTVALEIMLNIPPLDIYTRQIAKTTLVRLNQSNSLQSRIVRHSELVKDLGMINTDYMISCNIMDEELITDFPSVNDWTSGKVNTSEISIYTDGSKLKEGTGCGFFCNELNIGKFYRLKSVCSIFQAEIYAIAIAARHVSMLPIFNRDISFYIDSQAAIKALISGNIRSKVVSSCHKELLALRQQHKLKLCWVPGHKNILGNEKADELAKLGANLPEEDAIPEIFQPLSTVYLEIKQLARTEWINGWNESDSCVQTKNLWDDTKHINTGILLEMSKKQLKKVINLITGHNTLGKHLVRLNLSVDDTCRWCGEAVEDSYHFLCECPALSHRRFNTLISFRTCPRLGELIRGV